MSNELVYDVSEGDFEAKVNAGQLGLVGVVVSHPSQLRRRADATSRAAQAATGGAAVGPGRDRRVDRDVPTRAGRPGTGPDRQARAAPPAAARPHGRLLPAGVGAVCRCRLPGGAAAAGGGAAPAGPAPPRRPAAAAGEVRAGP